MTDRELLTAVSRVTGVPINRIVKTAHLSKRRETQARWLAVLAMRSLRPALPAAHLGGFVGLCASSGSVTLKRGNDLFKKDKSFRDLAKQLFQQVTSHGS